MPPDWCLAGMLQPYKRWLSVRLLPDAKERPVPSLMMAPVFLLNPASALGRVFPACPLPETGENGTIYSAKGTATHRMPVIVGPAAYFGVENKNQFGCSFRQPCSYGSSDVIQEGLHVLLRWFDEQFSVRISAHILSEEVEARCHVRDDCFHRGEFKPALAQKALDQQLTCGSGCARERPRYSRGELTLQESGLRARR